MNKSLLNSIYRNSRFIFIVLFIFSAGGLFMPISGEEDGSIIVNFLIHFFLFFYLAFFCFFAFIKKTKPAFIFLLVYIIASELIQEFFVFGRGYDFFDVGADLLGVLLGLFVFMQNKAKLRDL